MYSRFIRLAQLQQHILTGNAFFRSYAYKVSEKTVTQLFKLLCTIYNTRVAYSAHALGKISREEKDSFD